MGGVTWMRGTGLIVIGLYLSITQLLSPGSGGVDASNILFAPFPYKSHVGQMNVLGSGLKAKGHSIFIILPESYPDLEAARKIFHVLTYRVKDPDFYSIPPSEADDIMASVISVTPVEDIRTNVEGFIQFCTNCLEDEQLVAEISQKQIDIAVVDSMPNSRCYFILMHNLNIPYLGFTTQYEPWLTKTPALPSFVPFPFAAVYTDRMTFFERVGNLLALLDWSARPSVEFLEDEFVTKYLTRHLPDGRPVTYASLASKSQLWLVDTDWALEFPRPVMPNEIHVGGLTTRAAQPVQPGGGTIQSFVDTAGEHGLILATFGSTDILTDVHMDKFMKAFSRIQQSVLLRSEIMSIHCRYFS